MNPATSPMTENPVHTTFKLNMYSLQCRQRLTSHYSTVRKQKHIINWESETSLSLFKRSGFAMRKVSYYDSKGQVSSCDSWAITKGYSLQFGKRLWLNSKITSFHHGIKLRLPIKAVRRNANKRTILLLKHCYLTGKVFRLHIARWRYMLNRIPNQNRLLDRNSAIQYRHRGFQPAFIRLPQ